MRVALLSYTYGFNGIPYPNGDTWRANEIDEGEILRRDQRTRAGRRGRRRRHALGHGYRTHHEPKEQKPSPRG